jgi:hypothetical protein
MDWVSKIPLFWKKKKVGLFSFLYTHSFPSYQACDSLGQEPNPWGCAEPIKTDVFGPNRNLPNEKWFGKHDLKVSLKYAFIS